VCAPGFASNGVLGGTVPAAAGIAMAMQLDGSDAVSVAYVGDGTLGEGVLYETLNIASLWDLPLLIVCEDNAWSQSTPQHLNLAGRAAARFEAFDIPVRELDTTDVVDLRSAAADEVEATRGAGPRALLIHTYRLCHHSKSDDNRPTDEVSARWALDPLVVHGRRLDPEDRGRIDDEVAAAMDDVVDEARRML
jgi:TPP-dependent pyruvate/acetoin dehydrogenase alpha subunit